ncbi:MAG: type I methionyl aminopeptidase [Proteobacteria bacterium]|nr:type I methionyl aminopeptidase [Pseudomonadota bacterium]
MVQLKSHAEIEIMRRANIIVAEVLQKISEHIQPGVTTAELDERAEQIIRKKGGVPAFKGYGGFPATLCTSINEVVVHGIPSKDKVLKGGDIIGVDCGVCLEGFFGDSAVTFAVGKISEDAARLMKVTDEALQKAIEKAKVGNRLSDISHAVQSHVEQQGYSVVRSFVGHGIGKNLHENPQIPNFGPPGKGIRLKAGMVFAIEPMINSGGSDVVVLSDGWTAKTSDDSLSAHFEHSVAITDSGPYVLSQI